MTDHKWMVDVLEDLEDYAAKNELTSLQCQLGRARSTFVSEIKLAAISKELIRERQSAERLN